MSYLKGQNLRVEYGESAASIVAAATACTIHVAATLEDASTKDDTDDWSSQECTSKSWDISSDALVSVTEGESGALSGASITALGLIGKKVKVSFGLAQGDKNQTVSAWYSGEGIVNDVSVNATNKQNVTYTVQITGVGELTAGA